MNIGLGNDGSKAILSRMCWSYKVERTENNGISLLGKDGCLMCCTALEDDVPFECYVTQISS